MMKFLLGAVLSATSVAIASPLRRAEGATCSIDGKQLFLYNEKGIPSIEIEDIKHTDELMDLSTVAVASAMVEANPDSIKKLVAHKKGGTNDAWLKQECSEGPAETLVEEVFKGVRSQNIITTFLKGAYDHVPGSAWMALIQINLELIFTSETRADSAGNFPNMESINSQDWLQFTDTKKTDNLGHLMEVTWNAHGGSDVAKTIDPADQKFENGTLNEIDFNKQMKGIKKNKFPMILYSKGDGDGTGFFAKDTMYSFTPSDTETIGSYWARDVQRPTKEGLDPNPKLVYNTDLFDRKVKLVFIG